MDANPEWCCADRTGGWGPGTAHGVVRFDPQQQQEEAEANTTGEQATQS